MRETTYNYRQLVNLSMLFWTKSCILLNYKRQGQLDTFFLKFLNSQVEVAEQKSICPDRPKRKIYVRTVPDRKCLCPNFCAFTRLSCVHDQTFVRPSDY